MLSTDLSTLATLFLSVAAMFVSLWALIRTAAGERWLRDVSTWVQNENAEAVELRRVAALEASFTELRESFDQLFESHKKLRSRISMRELRARRQDGSDDSQDELDLASPGKVANGDAAAYKNKLRAQLRAQGILK